MEKQIYAQDALPYEKFCMNHNVKNGWNFCRWYIAMAPAALGFAPITDLSPANLVKRHYEDIVELPPLVDPKALRQGIASLHPWICTQQHDLAITKLLLLWFICTCINTCITTFVHICQSRHRNSTQENYSIMKYNHVDLSQVAIKSFLVSWNTGSPGLRAMSSHTQWWPIPLHGLRQTTRTTWNGPTIYQRMISRSWMQL